MSWTIFTTTKTATLLRLALDDAFSVNRFYLALTERWGDPDVLYDSEYLQKIMSDCSSSEAEVNAYQEFLQLQQVWEGVRELFQEATMNSEFELKEIVLAQ